MPEIRLEDLIPKSFVNNMPAYGLQPPVVHAHEFQVPSRPTKEQADEQLAHLAETKILLEALNQTIQNAEADRKQAELDRAEQKAFNTRMTIVALVLSFAAVVSPFLIYFLEHGWWWEAYRP